MGARPAADRPPPRPGLRPRRPPHPGAVDGADQPRACSGGCGASCARADEVLFTGSPPFLIHLLVPLNLLLRKRLVYRITDFHPECLMAELGRAPRRAAALFHRLDGGAATAGRRLRGAGRGPAPAPARDRHPGRAHRAQARPLAGRDPGRTPSPSSARRSCAGRVVLLYSGNFGVAHDHETFVEGYRRHHREGSGRVALWLNATGARADLVEEAAARGRAAGPPQPAGPPGAAARACW